MASEVGPMHRKLHGLRAGLRAGLRTSWRAFRGDDRGATAIEYGLIVTIMAVATVGMMTAFGTSLGQAFQTIAASLPFDSVE